MLSRYAYTYDSNGNIITTTETMGEVQNSVAYTYDKLNRIASVAGTKGADSYYEYDARGNRKLNFEQTDFLSEENAVFTYNAEDKLCYAQVGNNTMFADYSANGYRYIKSENSNYPEFNIYDSNGRLHALVKPVSLLPNGSETIVMYPTTQYIWGADRILAKIDVLTGNTCYYLYNGHGDVVQIVDTSGAIKNTYDYDVWGNFLNKEETIKNHFTYFGQTYDEATGLYYLRARYYDSSTGRFTQQDSAEDGYNWYVYCENNPIIKVDRSGYAANDWFFSEEDAAKDFAKIYNPISIENDIEYGTYIYSFEAIMKVENVIRIGTFYSYAIPVAGTSDSIKVSTLPSVSGRKIAIAHTHGKYKGDYSAEKISTGDISATRSVGLSRIYLATPGGYLRMCNVDNGFSKTIAFITYPNSSYVIIP